MFVLLRKVGESLLLDGMRVKVLSVENGQVRLGFENAAGCGQMPVVRSEVSESEQSPEGGK